MLTILICDPNFSPSVNRVSTLIKIRYWQKKGTKVSILCSTQAQGFYQKNLKKIKYLPFNYKFRGKSVWTIPWEYIQANFKALPLIFKIRNKFKVIYSLAGTIDFLFLPWLLKFIDPKVKWFVMVDNVVPKPNERPGNVILKTIPYLAFLAGNLLLKRTDGIFVVTNLLKTYYERKGIKVIKTGNGYGLDTDIFKGKISPKTPHFNALFGARLHPAKGIFDLVKIMRLVVKNDKNYTLGIMGNGDDKTKNQLYDTIKAGHLTRNIFFLGYKNGKERGDLYRNCDVFLFPSYAEGCPQVVIEAFAGNKLVVAYNLPEYQDVFKKYITKGQLVLFDKGDIENMAKYISEKRYTSLTFNNKLENFSWTRIIDKELNAFTH